MGGRPGIGLGASVLSTGLAVVAGNILGAGGGATQRVDTAGVVPMPTLVATRVDASP